MSDEINADGYNFEAVCPHCNERRGVSCSRTQSITGEPIEVYAIECDHSWKLTAEEGRKLRKNSQILG
jgi:hypothetical protein